MSELPNKFEENKYLVLRNLVPVSLINFINDYIKLKVLTNEFTPDNNHSPTALYKYADTLAETLLMNVKPEVESAAGKELFPTYSFLRIYRKGNILKKHIDRPSCEISLTLPIDYKDDNPWAIFVFNGKAEKEVVLNLGDALMYKGCEVKHWRNELHYDRHTQVMLHYVDKNGPNKEWKFDKRPLLGMKK